MPDLNQTASAKLGAIQDPDGTKTLMSSMTGNFQRLKLLECLRLATRKRLKKM